MEVSAEARALHDAADVIDLHVDSFIWRRIFGYDFRRRHSAFTRGMLMSQFDLPRAREAGVNGATWVITTNPYRQRDGRPDVFLENVRRLQGIFESVPDDFQVVRSVASPAVIPTSWSSLQG